MDHNKELYEKMRAEMGEAAFQSCLFEFRMPELVKTLRRAYVRCMSVDELLSAVSELEARADAGLIVDRLLEIESQLKPEQRHALASTLTSFASRVDQSPSAQKGRLEGCLRRLMRLLDSHACAEMAGACLDHPRRARRKMAIDVLRHVGVTPELGKRLLELYERYGDEESLVLIARSPKAIAAIDPVVLLSRLQDQYWRARVIQTVIESGLGNVQLEVIAAQYPFEFTHAVGRSRTKELLPILLTLFRDNCGDPDFLSIFAWCLGILGAREHLALVEDAVSQALNTIMSTKPFPPSNEQPH